MNEVLIIANKCRSLDVDLDMPKSEPNQNWNRFLRIAPVINHSKNKTENYILLQISETIIQSTKLSLITYNCCSANECTLVIRANENEQFL